MSKAAPLYRVGLTGSIAMGKSTTAALFAKEGVPVHDADAVVAALYAAGGKAGPALRPVAPRAVDAAGAVDKAALKTAIAEDASVLAEIEAVVHPLVLAERHVFEDRVRAAGGGLALYDIPLLFETGAAGDMDAVIVVSAPLAVQRERALARPEMTETHLERILARQLPDGEKRARADFVIETDRGIEDAAAQVREILRLLKVRATAKSSKESER